MYSRASLVGINLVHDPVESTATATVSQILPRYQNYTGSVQFGVVRKNSDFHAQCNLRAEPRKST
eukprot:m.49016 g.49016  ORF g.49016 m.49016 type:complete len:65 (-) comp8937_c0_seq1:1160-1354(-)